MTASPSVPPASPVALPVKACAACQASISPDEDVTLCADVRFALPCVAPAFPLTLTRLAPPSPSSTAKRLRWVGYLTASRAPDPSLSLGEPLTRPNPAHARAPALPPQRDVDERSLPWSQLNPWEAAPVRPPVLCTLPRARVLTPACRSLVSSLQLPDDSDEAVRAARQRAKGKERAWAPLDDVKAGDVDAGEDPSVAEPAWLTIATEVRFSRRTPGRAQRGGDTDYGWSSVHRAAPDDDAADRRWFGPSEEPAHGRHSPPSACRPSRAALAVRRAAPTAPVWPAVVRLCPSVRPAAAGAQNHPGQRRPATPRQQGTPRPSGPPSRAAPTTTARGRASGRGSTASTGRQPQQRRARRAVPFSSMRIVC